MINLGDKVKDKITGLTGIVVGIANYLAGCRRIGVQPQEVKDGKPIDSSWFDEPQLEVITPGAVKSFSDDNGPGGPAHLVDTGRATPRQR